MQLLKISENRARTNGLVNENEETRMRKITQSEIVREIYLAHMDEIEQYIEVGETKMDYTKDIFSTDMVRNGLVVDPGTIRMKWKILEANDVIRSERKLGKIVYHIPVRVFFPFVSSDLKALMREGERQRETERDMLKGGVL